CSKTYLGLSDLTMLYDRWRQIARERHDQLALGDLATGEQWTFGALASAAESQPDPSGPVYPAGHGGGFLLDVLQGWRSGQVVCPVEPGHRPPSLGGLPASITPVKATSAPTGAPRFLLFTGAQLMADAANIMETMGLRSEWPNLGV